MMFVAKVLTTSANVWGRASAATDESDHTATVEIRKKKLECSFVASDVFK